jgi:hypothetical protein
MKKFLAFFCIIVFSAAMISCNKKNKTTSPSSSPQTSTAVQTTQAIQIPQDTENEKYDKNGNLIYKKHVNNKKNEKEEFFVYDENNTLLSHEVLEYEYDKNGNLAFLSSYDVESNGSKTVIFEQKYVYDAKNRIREEEFYVAGKSGKLFLREKITSEYDGEDTLISKESILYTETGAPQEGTFLRYNGNGAQTELCREKYSADKSGNITEIRGESLNAKNELLFTYTTLIEYGKNNQALLETRREYRKDGG